MNDHGSQIDETRGQEQVKKVQAVFRTWLGQQRFHSPSIPSWPLALLPQMKSLPSRAMAALLWSPTDSAHTPLRKRLTTCRGRHSTSC